MTHHLEIMNGKTKMAWSGETPWHGLGTKVPRDLTPIQMLEASGNDWLVEKIPAFIEVNQTVQTPVPYTAEQLAKFKKAKKKVPALKTVGETKLVRVKINAEALVRTSDGKVLDTVSADWNPVQNHQAMEFFNQFVEAGKMEMSTVGSLKGGQIVWGLAKVKESFELFKGDKVESHLLFTNFHKYGFSTDVRFTPVRVVCWNTLCLSLDSNVERMVKYSHRREFNPEAVKDMLGIAKEKLGKYEEMAAFLGSKKAKNEDIVEYFKRIMPGADGKLKDLSKNAEITLDLLEKQPGTQFAPGSWWQAFNAVTFFFDHVVCKTADQRLKQAWYGSHKSLKTKALELALDYAGK